MRNKLIFAMIVFLYMAGFAQTGSAESEEEDETVKGRIFYVRQTVGNDANDGMSPENAWRSISRLSKEMTAGDTVYIGPGLYREGIWLHNSGTVNNKITFIADTTGKHTGDPPGVVMVTGSEPVDEGIFKPHSASGVYMAKFPDYKVWGVVEMDGPQYRYKNATNTALYIRENMPATDVVAKLSYSYFYDEEAKVLFIHTSDGKHPSEHEIELIRRGNGIFMREKHYVTIIGFTFRHMGDAGINFFKGSSYGVAINNNSYGSRQGIRVYNATNIVVYDNTLFRNENSGIYFAAESTNGLAIGNTAYENIKGVRWSSQSVGGIGIDNTLFDNHEAGISIEKSDDTFIRRNKILNNKSQLMVYSSDYDSDDNCIENNSSEQLIAEFLFDKEYKTLDEYQQVQQQDIQSREGSCGRVPEKLDVIKLHTDTMSYTERAVKILKGLKKTQNKIP